MRNLIFGIILFLMLSCKENSNNPHSFDMIDVSIYNGWTDVICMRVNYRGEAYIYNNNISQGKTYFQTNMGSNEIDSISKYASIIFSLKLDTFYSSSCQDCGAYSLIIKSKNNIFRSRVYGINSTDKTIEPMNVFINYLYHHVQIKRDSLDICFNFESNSILPPPPPPMEDENVKYTPPNVIDTLF